LFNSCSFLVLEFLEKKCGILHGDISPFNLVIIRRPAAISDGGIVSAEGVAEDVESFGSPIDYDYSRKCGVGTAHVSVSFMLQVNSLN
jgi:hypothetical protein